MKAKKIYRLILVLSVVLGIGSRAYAQWAGGPREMLRGDDNFTLSVPNPDPNACYTWSGPNIIGDANQPTVKINPQHDATYTCTRISNRGVEQDKVPVKVINKVTIKKIKPLRNCYSPGDDILLEDFEIETNPKGYESYVYTTPLKISENQFLKSNEREVEISFNIRQPFGGIYAPTEPHKVKVHVIGGIESGTLPIGLKHINTIKGALSGQSLSTILQNNLNFDENNNRENKLEWKFKNVAIGLSTDFDFTWHYECCNNKAIYLLDIAWGGGYVSVSTDQINSPCILIPYTPTCFYLYGEFGVRMDFGSVQLTSSISWPTECFDASIGFQITAYASGGAGIAVKDPNLLSVQGGIKASGSTSGNFSFTKKELTCEPFTVKFDLETKITFLTLNVQPYNRTLFEHHFANTLVKKFQ